MNPIFIQLVCPAIFLPKISTATRSRIPTAIRNFGKYGKNSPYTNIIPTDSLRKIKPLELTTIIKQFCSYPHRILYYGPGDQNNLISYLKVKHTLPLRGRSPCESSDLVLSVAGPRVRKPEEIQRDRCCA